MSLSRDVNFFKITLLGGFLGAVVGALAVSAEVTITTGIELCGPIGAVAGGIAYALLIQHREHHQDGHFLFLDRAPVLGVLAGAAAGMALAGTRKFFSSSPAPNGTDDSSIIPNQQNHHKTEDDETKVKKLQDHYNSSNDMNKLVKNDCKIEQDNNSEEDNTSQGTLDDLSDVINQQNSHTRELSQQQDHHFTDTKPNNELQCQHTTNEEESSVEQSIPENPKIVLPTYGSNSQKNEDPIVQSHWTALDDFIRRVHDMIKADKQNMMDDRSSRIKRTQIKMVLYMELEGLLEPLIQEENVQFDEVPNGLSLFINSRQSPIIFDDNVREFFHNVPAQLGRRPLRERLMECLIYRIRCPEHPDFNYIGQHAGLPISRSDLLIHNRRNLMADHAVAYHTGETFDRIFEMDLLRQFLDHSATNDDHDKQQSRVRRSWELFYQWIYKINKLRLHITSFGAVNC